MNYTASPAFSLSKSLKKSISEMSDHNPIVPGPIYNVAGLGQRSVSLSHSIGKSKRTEINHRIEPTPSPMHYQPNKSSLPLSKTIAKSSFIEIINENPDPACYITDEKHTTKKVLAYTLTSREPSIMDQKNANPGPADYQPQQNLPVLSRSKNKKESFFGSDSRFKEESKAIPGVGNYLINSDKLSNFQHKYSIGKSERTIPTKELPGPSDYPKLSFAQENLKGKLGKSLSGRLGETFQSQKTTIDAFHKYLDNPEQLFADSKTSPKYSIGKDKREMFRNNRNPGPSQYINNQFLSKHSSTALMPLSERTEYNDSIFKPGPGTYQIEAQKGLKYSFPRSKSLVTVDPNANPGVGRYQLEKLNLGKAGSFSKSSRFLALKSGVGVGDYQLSSKKDLKCSMSKSSRFHPSTLNTPGPGDYHIHPLIGYKSESK